MSLLDVLFKSGQAINVTEQLGKEIKEMGPMSGKEKKFIAVLS